MTNLIYIIDQFKENFHLIISLLYLNVIQHHSQQCNTLKITDNNLLIKLLILETPQNMRFYIMIIWNPTLKAQMKTNVYK